MLARYIQHWGMPSERVVSRNESKSTQIEIYFFPARSSEEVCRLATIGISGTPPESGDNQADWELLLTLPSDIAGESFETTSHFLLDVAVYSLRHDVGGNIGTLVPETPLAPRAWKPRALLFDEPRGEAESLATISVGAQDVRVLWIVPIFASEYSLIEDHGLDAFDRACEKATLSVVDVRRDPFI